LAVVAKVLGIPAVDMFDYEWATLQHNVGCRPARRVMTPDTIPPERLRRYGVTADKLAQFPGLKEDYYLADFEPDRGVLAEIGLDPGQAVDGQSLVALVDVVVSAGGTMNREAVALGTPVYTTYGGRLGGVDEALIRDGRLRPLTDPRALELVKRPPGTDGLVRRDPRELAQLVLEAAA